MDPPKEPSKPGLEVESDAALAASAANAVEQWRTYQNAYALYQQQQAAYELYMQKQSTVTSLEEQQAAYNQYLEAHNSYQKQLEMYEQQKAYQEYYSGAAVAANGAATVAAGYYPTTTTEYQPAPMPVPPAFTTPLAHVDSYYRKAADHHRDPSQLKQHSEASRQRAKVYTSTNYYATPEDEKMFPEELKAMFKDLDCGLCKCKMNSHISANVHYQSKVHEKKIIQWLKDWCERTGTPMPYRARRKVVQVEPVGPNSLRCEACDLPLTSIQHANQHYTGKRHRMVVMGKKTPAGKGYFNKEGNWTRRNLVPDENPERFGIGQSFAKKAHYGPRDAKRMRLEPPPSPPKELLSETSYDPTVANSVVAPAAVPSVTPTFPQPAFPQAVQQPIGPSPALVAKPKPVTTVESEVRKKESADCVDDSGVFCKVCQIAVTSAAVMETHLKGLKHIKKLKSVGRMPPPSSAKGGCSSESILAILTNPQPQQNDWSLYRMPSGKYYCKTCNSIMADEKLFSQHWYGKKHKLKAKQEMEELTGADKKPKGFYRRPFVKKPYQV